MAQFQADKYDATRSRQVYIRCFGLALIVAGLASLSQTPSSADFVQFYSGLLVAVGVSMVANPGAEAPNRFAHAVYCLTCLSGIGLVLLASAEGQASSGANVLATALLSLWAALGLVKHGRGLRA